MGFFSASAITTLDDGWDSGDSVTLQAITVCLILESSSNVVLDGNFISYD